MAWMLFDADTAVRQRLTRDLPNLLILAENDETTATNLPYLVFHTAGPGQDDAGLGVWPVTVTLTVVGAPDSAFTTMRSVYSAVHGWEATRGPDTAGVVTVRDQMKPAWEPASASLNDKSLVQWEAIFTILFRSHED